jgi:hypothetical protein
MQINFYFPRESTMLNEEQELRNALHDAIMRDDFVDIIYLSAELEQVVAVRVEREAVQQFRLDCPRRPSEKKDGVWKERVLVSQHGHLVEAVEVRQVRCFKRPRLPKQWMVGWVRENPEDYIRLRTFRQSEDAAYKRGLVDDVLCCELSEREEAIQHLQDYEFYQRWKAEEIVDARVDRNSWIDSIAMDCDLDSEEEQLRDPCDECGHPTLCYKCGHNPRFTSSPDDPPATYELYLKEGKTLKEAARLERNTARVTLGVMRNIGLDLARRAGIEVPQNAYWRGEDLEPPEGYVPSCGSCATRKKCLFKPAHPCEWRSEAAECDLHQFDNLVDLQDLRELEIDSGMDRETQLEDEERHAAQLADPMAHLSTHQGKDHEAWCEELGFPS